MEKVTRDRFHLKEFFLKKPVPFSQKRDIKWSVVRNVLLGNLGIAILVILFMPSKSPQIAFRDDKISRPDDKALKPSKLDSSMPSGLRGYRSAMGNLNGGPTRETSRARQAAMIISRSGLDATTQLPPGSRLKVRLIERVVVSNQAFPVIGVVVQDADQGGVLAVPKGAKIFGEVAFDPDLKRGQIIWKAIRFGSARMRALEAISTGLDGQAGVEGVVHSNATMNMVGQTMTRLVGAYAEGSMERTAFFGSPGGRENGMKNAVSATAKDHADRIADDMKKEKVWLELKPDNDFYVLLTQSFQFRDPGGAVR